MTKLKRVISNDVNRRKKEQKIKRVHRAIEDRNEIRRAKAKAARDEEQSLAADPVPPLAGMGDVKHIDVDAFLRGELTTGDDGTSAKKDKRRREREEDASDDNEQDDSDEEDDDGDDQSGESGEEDDEELGGDLEEEENDEEDDEEKVLADEEQFKADLKALEKTDPSFYKHLLHDSKHLLKFADDDHEDDGGDEEPHQRDGGRGKEKRGNDDDDDGGVDDDGEETGDGQDRDAGRAKPISNTQLAAIVRSVMKSPNMRTVRTVLNLYHGACLMGTGTEKRKMGTAERSLLVSSPEVRNNLLRFCWNHLPKSLHRLLVGSSKAAEAAAAGDSAAGKLPLKSLPGWSRMEKLLKSYVKSTLRLVDSSTDAALLRPALEGFRQSVPFVVQFAALCRRSLRLLLRLWSSAEVGVRVESFLRIRDLVLAAPPERGLLEAVLKDSYLTYVRSSQFVTQQTLPHVQFMANCVVELYAIDPAASYQHAFVYIRQLAIHLRNAVISKEKDAHRNVYNWSFVNCLRVWALVLGAHGSTPDRPLRALVYPLVQICLNTVQLVASMRYVPLRFFVVELLTALASRTGVFVPLGPVLLAVLDLPEFRRRPTAAAGRQPAIQYLLKVGKTLASTQAFQQVVFAQLLRLLVRFYAVYSHSVSFPELALPAQLQLRRFAKETQIPAARKQAQLAAEKLERNAQFVSSLRAQLKAAPKDLVGDFKVGTGDKSPLEKYVELEGEAEVFTLERVMASHRSSDKKKKGGGDDSDVELDDDDDGDDDDDDDDEEEDDEKDRRSSKKSKVHNKKDRTRAREQDAEDDEKKKSARKRRKKTSGPKASAGEEMDDYDEPADRVGVLELSDDE